MNIIGSESVWDMAGNTASRAHCHTLNFEQRRITSYCESLDGSRLVIWSYRYHTFYGGTMRSLQSH